MEEDSKKQPQKKNWFKEKFNLVDPSEREFYERRSSNDIKKAGRFSTIAARLGTATL
jgi:hypothetical protein